MKKFKVTKKISDKYLRDTAFHEAGHHIALFSLGGLGASDVWRNPDKDPSQRPWRGRFCMMGKPSEVNMSAEFIQKYNVIVPTPERWQTYVGMAGNIAEALDGGERDPEVIFCDLSDGFNTDGVSDSDKEMMGDEWYEDDVKFTMELLLERWESVEIIADDLMRNARNN